MKVILNKLPICYICKKSYNIKNKIFGFHTTKNGNIENCKYILPSQFISKPFEISSPKKGVLKICSYVDTFCADLCRGDDEEFRNNLTKMDKIWKNNTSEATPKN